MSAWLNKAAIIRDLSRAQGRVPVDVAGTVAAADLPPLPETPDISEDEFFLRNYIGCGEGQYVPPDLGLIKHMLNVVQEFNSPLNDEADDQKVIEICNISSMHYRNNNYKKHTKESVPAVITQDRKSPKKVKKNERKPRNVAIMSLLENQLNDNQNTSEGLPKPKTVRNAIQKVNGWLDNQDKNGRKSPKKTGLLDLDAFMLFKKRPAVEKPVVKPIEERTVKSPHNNNYVPSEQAKEYYNRCKQNSKMKELVVDNIWIKVEKEMKAIEEHRKKFTECLKLSRDILLFETTPTGTTEFDDPRFKEVRLLQHRHSLSNECIVCAVRIKNDQKNDQNKTESPNWRQTPQSSLESSPENNF